MLRMRELVLLKLRKHFHSACVVETKSEENNSKAHQNCCYDNR